MAKIGSIINIIITIGKTEECIEEITEKALCQNFPGEDSPNFQETKSFYAILLQNIINPQLIF